MIDEHKVFFEWPHSEPTEVIVCGSFNDWARTCHLTKGPTGFTGFTYVPWGSKITYKYIVDGVWSTHPEEPTESDEDGNINNMYIAPSQPGKPAPAEAPSDTAGNVSQTVAHFVDTIAAREGTSSTLDYAASGFGAALNSIVGVDPINAEQIALPTPVQSTETAGTEFDATRSSVSDGVPLSSVSAEVLSSQHHVSENPITLEDPRAVLTPEFPEKKASDIPVPIVPVNAAEDHTVSTPVAELALTPAEDSIGSIHSAVKVNEDVPVAVEDSADKVEGIPMTVEEPHTTVERTPDAESVLAEKATTSRIVDMPIAAAGDKASLVASEDPASTREEHSKEASQVLKTPEAITPASDLNPSLVLASEGIPTPSSTPEEKAMPQDMPIVPSAPLQKGLDKFEQTEPAPVAYDKLQPVPVVKPGSLLDTSDVATGSEIAETGLAAQPQAQKEMEESVPVLSLPAGQINASPVENGTESLVESQSAKQGKEVLETEAKAKTTQGESTSLSTQVSAPASEPSPAPVQTTVASTVTAAPTEPRPAADNRSPENLSVFPEVAQSAPTPVIQATPLELGLTSPTSVSEVAHKTAPKTENAPISRSESAPTQDASGPVAPLNGRTEEAVVSAPASVPATKAFPSTVSPIASPSKSGKAVPERKKKLSIFGKIKHFFESDKGKSKNKSEN